MTKQHHYFLFSQAALTMGPLSAGCEVRWVVRYDDGHGPPFFLSYARTVERSRGTARVPGPDRRVEDFFHDLAENVGQLIHLPADVPAGFMDQEMRGGMQWTDELLYAVGTCQVLVALLSAPYLKSEWCRMEWHAFDQRTVTKVKGAQASPRQGCIIPVRWAPFHDEVPPHIGKRLIFSPDRDPEPKTPDHYLKYGVLGLMTMGMLRDSYEIVAWQLSTHIAHIFHSQRTQARGFQLAELSIASLGDDHGC